MKNKIEYTETKCPKCNNDFAYKEEEIIEENNKKYIICPICGERIELLKL